MAERLIADIWTEALGILRGQMTKATFDTWLSGTWVVEASSGEWVIGVRHAYALDWLESRLGDLVTGTLGRAVGKPVAVRFVVAKPVLAGESRDQLAIEEPEDADDLDEPGPVLEAVREERVTLTEHGALQWTDFYIKFKVAFRKRALKNLKGARLSVFLCLALHVDRDGVAQPGGIEAIMHETGYSRGAVCSALDALDRAGLIQKRPQHHGSDQYAVLGYAWFGQSPAPSLWEVGKSKSKKQTLTDTKNVKVRESDSLKSGLLL